MCVEEANVPTVESFAELHEVWSNRPLLYWQTDAEDLAVWGLNDFPQPTARCGSGGDAQALVSVGEYVHFLTSLKREKWTEIVVLGLDAAGVVMMLGSGVRIGRRARQSSDAVGQTDCAGTRSPMRDMDTVRGWVESVID